MDSPDLTLQHAVDLPRNSATLAPITIPQQTRDDAATASLGTAQNPLWVMAIALGAFLGFAAAVIAFS